MAYSKTLTYTDGIDYTIYVYLGTDETDITGVNEPTHTVQISFPTDQISITEKVRSQDLNDVINKMTTAVIKVLDGTAPGGKDVELLTTLGYTYFDSAPPHD